MLKNLLRIPNIFDPDDYGRRQILNTLILFLILTSLATEAFILLTYCDCVPVLTRISNANGILLLGMLGLVLPGILLFANRSPRIPFWLTGAVFILFVIALLSQADTPHELYAGRSTVIWVLPIMLSAMIFHPSYGFLIAAIICGIMQAFIGLDNNYIDPTNYYSMLGLFLVALISWVGTSIANRAVHDAHRQAVLLEAVLHSVTDGVLMLDPQGKFLSANPALSRMIPEHELKELSLNSKEFEKIVHWKRKIFTVTTTPVAGVGDVIIFRDQTRTNETERARDALLATISHEFRTPLTVVMNYLEMLLMLTKMRKVNTQAFTEHLTRAVENSRRLQHLIINILDQARIQAGVLTLKDQRFNLHRLLEKSGQFAAPLLQQKGLSYELNIATNVPSEISTDPERLEQVLTNLIDNAIKFTNRGGITIRAFVSTGKKLSIEVADSGPGILEEQLPDIFETFRRASNYAQREHQGAGLGLSIAREIITRMGGEISVSSTPGIGSTFTISLPLAKKIWY